MSEDEILGEVEGDPHTLRQRTKEILKGKNVGILCCLHHKISNQVNLDLPRDLFSSFLFRKQRRREHPTSPNKYRKCSRRCFDGQLRTWRRNLHQFDENNQQDLPDSIDMNQPNAMATCSIDNQAS